MKGAKSKHSKEKQCFIICPVGKEDSDIRRNTDGLISIIRPILEEKNYKVIPAHEIASPGSITNQIIEYLLTAELVVAILSPQNPNVMYELAVRHATGLPILCIANDDTQLPFDLKDERIIMFPDEIKAYNLLIERFQRTLHLVESESEPNNPIYRVSKNKVMKDYMAKSSDVDQYILDRLGEINYQLAKLTTTNVGSFGFDDFETRPAEIFAKVEQFGSGDEKLVIIIGILNDEPFEIFTSYHNDHVGYIPNSVKEGLIIRSKGGNDKIRYDFRFTDREGYTVTIEGLSRAAKRWYSTPYFEKYSEEDLVPLPEKLKAKVLRFKTKNKDIIIIIGILKDEPFEIFTSISDERIRLLPDTVEDAIIINTIQDNGKRCYDLSYHLNEGVATIPGVLNNGRRWYNISNFRVR